MARAASEDGSPSVNANGGPFLVPTTLISILAAVYYIATSVSLTLFNKLLFSRFPASDPPFLLLCQSLTAVLILGTLKLFGKFTPPNLFLWTRQSFRAYSPLFISNLCMLLTSLIALKFTSLLMYNTLRRTSMIFVVAIHSYVTTTRPSPYTVGATALVTCGALIAGTTDLSFDPLGYGLALAANISTALYLVLLKPVRDKLHLSNLELIFVNALSNIPVLFAIICFFPPEENLLEQFNDATFAFFFLSSCALAVVINHAIFVNTTTNDAIAQSVSSQLKDVALLIISLLFIDDPKHRAAGNLQGVLVGFFGSLVYGVGKLMNRNKIPNKSAEELVVKPSSSQDESGDEEKVILMASENRVSD